MELIEFNAAECARLLNSQWQYIEIIATGKEIETSEGYFKKEIRLIPHETKPKNSNHYTIPVNDSEVAEMAEGSDTDIFYIERP
jgi:hypothetical protein